MKISFILFNVTFGCLGCQVNIETKPNILILLVDYSFDAQNSCLPSHPNPTPGIFTIDLGDGALIYAAIYNELGRVKETTTNEPACRTGQGEHFKCVHGCLSSKDYITERENCC